MRLNLGHTAHYLLIHSEQDIVYPRQVETHYLFTIQEDLLYLPFYLEFCLRYFICVYFVTTVIKK